MKEEIEMLLNQIDLVPTIKLPCEGQIDLTQTILDVRMISPQIAMTRFLLGHLKIILKTQFLKDELNTKVNILAEFLVATLQTNKKKSNY